MYDVSKLSSDELLDYQLNYLCKKALEDIFEFYSLIDDLSDKSKLATQLHSIVLQFDPGY